MATTPDNTAPKQARGRFKKGESGNPAGKPRGARNRVTLAVERLLEADAVNIAAVALQYAKAGDTTLIKAVLDRVAPARKEARIAIGLPPLETPQDAPAVIAALLAKVADGQIAPGEAQSIVGLLEAFRRQSELADIEARLSRLEEIDGKTR